MHLHDRSLSWLVIDNSINCDWVKTSFMGPSHPRSEMMRPCKCLKCYQNFNGEQHVLIFNTIHEIFNISDTEVVIYTTFDKGIV